MQDFKNNAIMKDFCDCYANQQSVRHSCQSRFGMAEMARNNNIVTHAIEMKYHIKYFILEYWLII